MISELLPEEKRRLSELEQELYHLENGNKTIKIADIYLGLDDMLKRLENLDLLALQESKQRRDDYRRRISHLKSSHLHIKLSLDNYAKKCNYNHHEYQKQLLFSGVKIDSNENSYYDIEKQESDSLNKSKKMINEYIQTGQETLSELLSQRERLKGVQRKVFDIMNYLGLSNTIMRSVEKRDAIDKWIVIAGILIVLALLYFILFYWRK